MQPVAPLFQDARKRIHDLETKINYLEWQKVLIENEIKKAREEMEAVINGR
jgi:predicted  nucleic acid-binding Zn-ribbon protein